MIMQILCSTFPILSAKSFPDYLIVVNRKVPFRRPFRKRKIRESMSISYIVLAAGCSASKMYNGRLL